MAGICLATDPALARDIYVNCHIPAGGNGSPSLPYKTIQEGVDSAAPTGDTVRVAAGTYTGTTNPIVRWTGKSVALIGAGAGSTFVDGQGARQCMALSDVPDTARIEGFTFSNGSADNGGAIYVDHSAPTLANNTFSGNRAVYWGGAVMLTRSPATLTSNTFAGNWSGNEGGALHLTASAAAVTDNTFTGNTARFWGGAIRLIVSSPTLTNNTFAGNSAGVEGGALHAVTSSPTLANCTFNGNTATGVGGAVYLLNASPTLANCTFSGNTATEVGGAVCLIRASPPIANCTFARGSASLGSAIYANAGGPTTPSLPVIVNSIVWGNSSPSISVFYSTATFSYSNIQGGHAGEGNIAVDPLFVDAAHDDLHLQPDSPCIGAGTWSAGVPGADMEGSLRPNPPTLGAYEGSTAHHLAFTSGPAGTIAGAAVPVQVTIYDETDAVATGFCGLVTLSVKSGPGGLSGTCEAAAVAGVATLSPRLFIPGNYVLTASSGSLTADSVSFRVQPALAFGVPPTSTYLVSEFSPTVEVALLDALGNPIVGASDSITLSLTGGAVGARLYGAATVSASNGVARFPGLRISRPGRGYRLVASCGALPAATSAPFDVVSTAPVAVRFVSQPAGGRAGGTMAPFQVEVIDGRGQRVTSGSYAVRLSLSRNPGRALLSGGVANTADGVATFDSVSLSNAGAGYALCAVAPRLSGVRSDTFNVVP